GSWAPALRSGRSWCRRPPANVRSRGGPASMRPSPWQCDGSFIVPLCDARRDFENAFLPFGETMQFAANLRVAGLFALDGLVLLAVDFRAVVDAFLHGADHLQLGNLVEQLLIDDGRLLTVLGLALGLLLVHVVAGLLQGVDHLFESVNDILLDGLGDDADIDHPQA